MLETSTAQLGGTKLAAASALPIGWIALIAVGGFIAWQQWRGRQEMAELRVAVKDEKQLEHRLDTLLKEQRELSERIHRLHEQVEQQRPNEYSTQALTNEAAKPAQSVAKLAMLKRLVDDNLNLREQLKK